jgi:endonuclease/exonuclease/phosphatase family metal-dependent hydrolase
MTLPLALLFNAVLLGVAGLKRRPMALLPLAVLVIGWGYVQRGFAVHPPPTLEPPRALPGAALPTRTTADSEPADSARRLRVMSYNVRIFNYYRKLADANYASSDAEVRWLDEQPADVLCLQEFYNQTPQTKHAHPYFATRRRLSKNRHAVVSVAYRREGQEFGLAIFSRFKVIDHGAISFKPNQLSQNHAMWADLRMPPHDGHPADTIRVYNVHFQSMSLDEEAIVETTERRAWLEASGLGLLRRFRNGAVKRSRQADTVAAHIRTCRYPVVVCGDFNDVPYSYTYSVFNNLLANAHQTVGAGVGSTYHGRLPLLRIDNQFSTPGRLDAAWVKVHSEVPYSDHFPLEVIYRVGQR